MIEQVGGKGYTRALLIRMYWNRRQGLCTVDEWMTESKRILKEGLEDRVRVELARVWGL